MHGMDGGEVDASAAVVEESVAGSGAEIMGRNKFGGGPGPWSDDDRGTGGGARIRRSTSRSSCSPTMPASRSKLSDTTFTFVTDGIESALEQARQRPAGRT